VHLAVDFHIDLIEVAFPLPKAFHPAYPLAPDFSSKDWAEPVLPVPHRLVADVDPAFCQPILDVPHAQPEPCINHHHQPDDLR
jgi:hypothetical protein